MVVGSAQRRHAGMWLVWCAAWLMRGCYVAVTCCVMCGPLCLVVLMVVVVVLVVVLLLVLLLLLLSVSVSIVLLLLLLPMLLLAQCLLWYRV